MKTASWLSQNITISVGIKKYQWLDIQLVLHGVAGENNQHYQYIHR
jgi:aspartyl aminopeptidase